MTPNPLAPDPLTIRTHDNVGIGYTVAGIGSRFLAQLLDVTLAGIAAFIATMGYLVVVGAFTPQTEVGSQLGPGLAAGGAMLFALFAFLAYFFVSELVTGGRTPGKAAVGIRVISRDGTGVRPLQTLIRSIVRIVDMTLYCGLVVMFFSPQARRIGDYLAGTVVIRERRAMLRPVVQAPPVYLRNFEPGPPIPGLERLGHHELSVVRSLLARPDLHPEQRERAASAMAPRLQDRLGLDAAAPERQEPAEAFVERLYLQLSAPSV